MVSRARQHIVETIDLFVGETIVTKWWRSLDDIHITGAGSLMRLLDKETYHVIAKWVDEVWEHKEFDADYHLMHAIEALKLLIIHLEGLGEEEKTVLSSRIVKMSGYASCLLFPLDSTDE